MSTSERKPLPYRMGNAGDLLKHGVLAEFVRWRIETGGRVRLLDLFAGEPRDDSSPPEVLSRLKDLGSCALADAQGELGEGRYLGSAKLVQHLGGRIGNDKVEVHVGDADTGRSQGLAAAGLQSLDALPACPQGLAGQEGYDAYAFLSAYIDQAEAQDLVLIDPFGEFLPDRSDRVIPQIEVLAACAAVLLFALNLDPCNSVGRRFDALLERHLPEAIIMTCPPLHKSGIKGESRHYADAVLASPVLGRDSDEKDALLTRLDSFATQLGQVLSLSNRSRCMLKPRVVGHR